MSCEEDIIDGFAIASFISFEALEVNSQYGTPVHLIARQDCRVHCILLEFTIDDRKLCELHTCFLLKSLVFVQLITYGVLLAFAEHPVYYPAIPFG